MIVVNFTLPRRVFGEKASILSEFIGIEVEEWRCQDIDNPSDWINAEIKYELLKKKGLI